MKHSRSKQENRSYRGVLGRLKRFAKKQGIKIVFKRELSIAEYNTDFDGNQEILIGNGWSIHKKVHTLLHELGHASLTNNEIKHRWSIQYTLNGHATSVELLTELDEEFEAWFRARLIANKLGIKLDKELFEQDFVAGIDSYIDHYVNCKAQV